MKTRIKAAVAVAIAIASAPAAGQPPSEWRPFELFAQRGFDLDEVHAFAISRGGDAGEIRTTQSGKRYGAYRSEYGVRYTVWPDFCEPAPCKGLVFAAYYPGDQFRLSTADLNEFNISRAHGNASFSTSGGSYVVQRLITNISGITNGGLAGEFGVFQGYSSKFDEFIRAKRNSAVNTVSAEPAADALTATAVSFAPGVDAAGGVSEFGEMALTPEEVLQDLLENAPADGIYYRGVAN